ncbi:hypothetical protein CDL12_25788 [Handroanthus impetiginosus]|uniref:NAC domain-containing protein n=1 Tax=Handroanthus impetiginosus TaxID=429701 RepID=A0A2G9G906_9LAMI|nr:hypothetical protein CDL12_25788 [Handroanthus impetiginosus]
MERANSEDGNGGVKLPIGFRFHPTDEELVIHYLRRKVCSQPLPAGVIPELEVLQTNPWDLPGDLKEKRHFFCQKIRRNLMNKCNSTFATDCGYWKATGKNKPIMAPGRNFVIGIKKSFVFYQGRTRSRGLKTQWIMHEFCLAASVNSPHLTQKLMVQVGDWVACRVYQWKRKARNQGTANQVANKNKNKKKPRTLQENNELGFSISQTSSSSCSSGITEISSSELDQEASSQNISF